MPAHLATCSVAAASGVKKPSRFLRQPSFNWQSTAFVMRGLRVRLPRLALLFLPCDARAKDPWQLKDSLARCPADVDQRGSLLCPPTKSDCRQLRLLR